jgi:hypothetical protein
MSRQQLDPLTRTHLGLRIDVRAKPHKLSHRSGAAFESSGDDRSPAILQHAQRPRSATMNRPNQPYHTAAAARVTRSQQGAQTVRVAQPERQKHKKETRSARPRLRVPIAPR